MKKIILALSLIFFAAGIPVYAQFSRYIIRLKDKSGSAFSINNPTQFLTQRAIDRRLRYNISIDETDLPVLSTYIDSIRLSGNVTILNVSKWFNQVCIQTNDAAALNKINSFSFVSSSSPIAARLTNKTALFNRQQKTPDSTFAATGNERPQSPEGYYDYGQSYTQVHLNNTDFLHNHGFRGEGMQLSIMDAGFYHYQTLPTFDSVRNNNQILGTWDFVANEASVNEDYYHGMNCFSIIAANLPGTFVGTAPKTSFYLFRTEDVNSEYPVEEQNWAAAAERADSLGADVFSVSLGYNTFDSSRFDHTYDDMNGHTTLIAKAASLAAKKGIIAVVAAGNEGSDSWHYITTPADADSVLAVGAVSSDRQAAGFSSYGPASDGRVKPDVAAIGINAVVANINTGAPSLGNGTSFACPVMAGTVTCLWQAFPEVNNVCIIDAIRKSSDKYNTPDDRTGYGIADAKKAFVYLIKKLYTQQISINSSCETAISIAVKTAADMNIIVERKFAGDDDYKTITTKNFNNSFAAVNFNYLDDLSGLPAGTSIKYRFKMSIASDTTFYLDSATVNYTATCAPVAETITISPNPVSDRLSVTITKNTPVKAGIEVHASNGQKVYSIANKTISGIQTFMIPMKQFSRGIYLVSVFFDGKKVTTKKVIR